jgi:hypothetical protein
MLKIILPLLKKVFNIIGILCIVSLGMLIILAPFYKNGELVDGWIKDIFDYIVPIILNFLTSGKNVFEFNLLFLW